MLPRRAHAFLLLSLLISAAPLLAQAPHADWRTVETARFRVHYPAAWEAWARHTAARLETVRDRVEAAVGWTIAETVDVLVMDPVAVANGSAWPMLGWPRMILWTSPPPPESSIGANRDWIEILTVHETAHLAHLLRPSRDPLQRLLQPLLPLGPIARAPRWVTEGYATLVEGELTGSGRPNSDFRAAVLRQWARAGRLPSYGQLHSDRSSWMGMSMAYLVGSAYLEWLREREGKDSLPRLWARMTARADRPFDAAFRGVYGDSPANLYRRFVAETTARALELERLLEPYLREGELWQDLSWTTGEPDLAPDGSKLVTVIRRRNEPSRIVVLGTGPDEKAERKERERIERMLERDPEDVAPVRRRPLPREPLHELPTRDGAEPYTPRFMPDGRSIVFVRFEPDADGFFHPDLFVWSLDEEAVRRVTRLADVRDPDPAPDGASAVAIRNRHGFSELVSVDLATGAVESIGTPSITETWAAPRWSRDGARLAYLRHAGGRWRLFVREGLRGAERELPLPPGAIVAQPAWGEDASTLFAAVGEGGFIEIHRFDLDTGGRTRLTGSLGASFAPAPAPDGTALYYLSIDADGLDIRRLPLGDAAPLPPVALDPSRFPPVLRPPTPAGADPVEPRPIGSSRPYGIGRQEFHLQTGGSWLPSNRAFEVGARFGDLVGRLDTIVTGSLGTDRGGAIASAWRGWPVEVRAHVFASDHRGSDQPGCDEGVAACDAPILDLERRGGELAFAWSRRTRATRLAAEAGLLFQTVDSTFEPFAGSHDQRVAFLELAPAVSRRIGKLGAGARARVRHEAGTTENEPWTRTRWSAAASISRSSLEVGVRLDRGTSGDTFAPFDRFALGGTIGSLLPASALGGRVEIPALPSGTAFGGEHEGQKASVAFGAPLRAFYERHRVWDAGLPRGAWIEIAGLEAGGAIDPMPVLRLPRLELRAGVARILTFPLEGETTWWIATAWRP